MKETKFSFYRGPIYNTTPTKSISLSEVADYIKSTTAKSRTQEIRDIISKGKEAKYIKATLDYVTAGGVFSKRNDEDLLSPSGLLTIDIDHIKESGLNLDELKNSFVEDKEIGLRLLFVSPSGNGLKLFCKSGKGYTDGDTYKDEYYSLLGYFHKTYNLPYRDDSLRIEGLDIQGGSHISMSCSLCYDEDVRLFPDEENSPVFDSVKHYTTREEIDKEMRSLRGEPEIQRRPVVNNDYFDEDNREYRDDLDRFKWNTLIPVMFGSIDMIFPSMEFKWRRNQWESPYKLSGEKSKSGRKEKSVITDKMKDRILEQGGGTIGVIDFYMERNGLSYMEAIRVLSGLCNLTLPEPKRDKIASYKTQIKIDKQFNDNTEIEPKMDEFNNGVATEEKRFRDRYTLPEKGEIWESFSQEPESILTDYVFSREKERENLKLHTEGITMICGMASHGKSTFLRNLALNVVSKEEGNGVVLFFTYEESKRKTILHLLSTYIGTQLSTGSNIERIREYAKSKSLQYITQSKRDGFKAKSEEFEALLTSGKLRVFEVADTSKELTQFLREYEDSGITIRAVFVDYIQRLSSGQKVARTDDLRLIAQDLQDYSKERKIPIVVATQLNRATPSPVKMGSNNIAESADLTRYADTIVCLWNSSKDEDISDDKFKGSKDESKLLSLGFMSGASGKIYARITKNREGESGLESVFELEGKSGLVKTNNDLPEGEDDSPKSMDGKKII